MAEDLLTSSANFTEVIQVELDGDTFSRGLSALNTEYRKFLKDLNAASEAEGIDPNKALGGAQLQGMQSTLQQFAASVKALRSELLDIFTPLSGDEVQTAIKKNEEVALASIDKQQAAEDSLNTKRRTDFEKMEILKAKAFDDDKQRTAQTFDYQLQQLENTKKAASQVIDAALKQSISEGVAPEVQSRDYTLAEQQAQKQIAARAKVATAAEAQAQREAEAANKASLAVENQTQREIAAYEKEQAAIRKRNSDKLKSLDDGYNAEAKATAAGHKLVQDELAKLNAANQAPAESGNKGFLGGLLTKDGLSGLSEYIGSVFRFALAWQAVQLALNAVIELIKIPFDVMKEGYQYLVNFQERASQLKANLADNIKFSDDPAKNMLLTAQAADTLTRKIDDLAIKLHVKAEAIQAGFETFLSFGGRNLVSSVDQGTDLIGLITAGLQSQNPNIGTRKIQTEIQNLVQANVSGASRLGAALGIPNAKLNEMALNARNTKDLFLQIQDAAPGLTQRLSEANDRQLSLADAIDEYKKRWEGLVMGPVFDRITKVLQDVLGWLDKHKDTLDSLAKAWGKLLDKVVEAGEKFFKQNWDTIKVTFQFMAGMATVMAGSIAAAVNSMVTLVALWQNLGGATRLRSADQLQHDADNMKARHDASMKRVAEGHPDTQEGDSFEATAVGQETYQKEYNGLLEQAAQKRAFDQALAAHNEAGDSIRNLTQMGVDIINGKYVAPPTPKETTPNGDATHDVTDRNKNKKPNLSELQEQFRAALDQIKTTFETQRNEIDEQVKAHQISVEQATADILTSLDGEKSAVKDTVDHYTALANATKVTDDQKKKFIATINHEQDALDRGLDKTGKSAKDTNVRDEQARAKQQEDIKAAAQKAYLEAQLSTAQYKRQQGMISETELAQTTADIKTQELAIDMQLAQAAVKRAGANQTEKEAAEAKVQALAQQGVTLGQQNARLIQQAQITDEINAAQARVIDAKDKEALAQQKLNNAIKNGVNNTDLLALQKQVAEAHLKTARAVLDEAQARERLAKTNKDANPQAFAQTQSDTHGAERDYFDAVAQARAAEKGYSPEDLKKILGFGSTEEAFKDLSNSLQSVNHLMQSFSGAIGGVINAFSKGGLGGGLSAIGGLLGNAGQMKDFGALAKSVGLGGVGSFLTSGAMGGISAALGIAGSLVSVISGLFTKAAQKIGEAVAKSVGDIMAKYQSQQATLGETITALEKERTDAISQLSGKKGGQDQLNKLLPQIDQQLASLQQQQKSIKDNFETSLTVLQAGSQENQKWVQTWIDINKNVKEYLDAMKGTAGYADAVQKANAYLNLQLQQQRKDMQDQLSQDEQGAIQDALQLNSLLQQRNDIAKQYKDQEYQILSADSLERRQSTAVSTGKQLADARKQRDQQLADIDNQVAFLTKKVDMEREVFGIATDTATLQKEALALQLDGLDAIKQGWLDLQRILANTANVVASGGQFPGSPFGGNGIVGVIPGMGNTTYNGGVVVNINNPTLPADPKAWADDLRGIIDRNRRLGLNA